MRGQSHPSQSKGSSTADSSAATSLPGSASTDSIRPLRPAPGQAPAPAPFDLPPRPSASGSADEPAASPADPRPTRHQTDGPAPSRSASPASSPPARPAGEPPAPGYPPPETVTGSRETSVPLGKGTGVSHRAAPRAGRDLRDTVPLVLRSESFANDSTARAGSLRADAGKQRLPKDARQLSVRRCRTGFRHPDVENDPEYASGQPELYSVPPFINDQNGSFGH
jgi:hypothetical protein